MLLMFSSMVISQLILCNKSFEGNIYLKFPSTWLARPHVYVLSQLILIFVACDRQNRTGVVRSLNRIDRQLQVSKEEQTDSELTGVRSVRYGTVNVTDPLHQSRFTSKHLDFVGTGHYWNRHIRTNERSLSV